MRGGRKNCDNCSRRKQAREWKAKNPEKVLAASRKWRAANPEATRAATEKWTAENREYIAEKSREWRNKPGQRERRNEWHRQWRQAHMPEISARVVQWQKDNPDKVKAKQDRRRARKAGAQICDFTADEWLEVLAEHDHRCAYCGDSESRLEVEHATPLARGGNHTKSNIVPACRSCNARKHTMTAEEFYERLGNLSGQG